MREGSCSVKLVSCLVLAVLIAFVGVLPGAAAHARASAPCEGMAIEHHARSTDEGCPGPHSGKVDLGLDHCTPAVGGCCASLPMPSVVGSLVTTTLVVAWISAIDRAPIGLGFAPATPPPRA